MMAQSNHWWTVGLVLMSLNVSAMSGNADTDRGVIRTESAAKEPPASWETRRYRIEISVAFADVAAFSPTFRKTILAELAEQVERYRGENWRVTIRESQELFPATSEELNRLDAAEYAAKSTAGFDKLLLATVSQTGAFLDVSAREWDQAIQKFSATISRRTTDRRALSIALFQAVNAVFRPTAMLDRFADGTATLRVRSGAYPPSDPTLSAPAEGDIWIPFYRKLEPDGSVKQIRELPWTFLELTTPPEPGMVTMESRLVTGLRSPLTNRRRLRVEALAIRARPEQNFTRLQLLSQTKQPLAGFDVDVRPRLDTPPEQVETQMTDRDGTLLITPLSQDSLVWFSVRSGEQILARLPYLPGLRAQESLQIPDDEARLEVEGKLAVLEGELMKAVVERAVLMSRIRKLAYAADWKQVEEFRTRLNELPAAKDLLIQLTAIRVPGMNAATAKNDRTTAGRIKLMCEQSGELINHYLDPDKLNELDEELAEIRKEAAANAELLDEDAAAATDP